METLEEDPSESSALAGACGSTWDVTSDSGSSPEESERFFFACFPYWSLCRDKFSTVSLTEPAFSSFLLLHEHRDDCTLPSASLDLLAGLSGLGAEASIASSDSSSRGSPPAAAHVGSSFEGTPLRARVCREVCRIRSLLRACRRARCRCRTLAARVIPHRSASEPRAGDVGDEGSVGLSHPLRGTSVQTVGPLQFGLRSHVSACPEESAGLLVERRAISWSGLRAASRDFAKFSHTTFSIVLTPSTP